MSNADQISSVRAVEIKSTLYADILSELSIVPLPLPVERRIVSGSRAVKWRESGSGNPDEKVKKVKKVKNRR
jgi:hypothetical protein